MGAGVTPGSHRTHKRVGADGALRGRAWTTSRGRIAWRRSGLFAVAAAGPTLVQLPRPPCALSWDWRAAGGRIPVQKRTPVADTSSSPLTPMWPHGEHQPSERRSFPRAAHGRSVDRSLVATSSTGPQQRPLRAVAVEPARPAHRVAQRSGGRPAAVTATGSGPAAPPSRPSANGAADSYPCSLQVTGRLARSSGVAGHGFVQPAEGLLDAGVKLVRTLDTVLDCSGWLGRCRRPCPGLVGDGQGWSPWGQWKQSSGSGCRESAMATILGRGQGGRPGRRRGPRGTSRRRPGPLYPLSSAGSSRPAGAVISR